VPGEWTEERGERDEERGVGERGGRRGGVIMTCGAHVGFREFREGVFFNELYKNKK
jgi:hypothetical protein